MYLLFPGRHHLVTSFQHDYLAGILSASLKDVLDIKGHPLGMDDQVEAIIFAVTSANHSNTREIHCLFTSVRSRSRSLANTSVPGFIYGIDDVGNVNFSCYTVKRIQA